MAGETNTVKKDINHATHKVNGEIGIVWLNPATGTPTGCPPAIAWVQEAIVPSVSRTAPLKTADSIDVYGWSILNLKSQKRNALHTNIFERRIFYRKPSECRTGKPLPFNAVDPRTVAPGIPGLRAAVVREYAKTVRSAA